jgi:hypothetical protein
MVAMRMETRGDGEPQAPRGTGDQSDAFFVRHIVES